jgi:hypothetical protein
MFYPIRNGTKITVGEGFQVWVPPPPSDTSQIINYGLPIEEQYWKREPIPKWYIERAQEEEYKQSLDQELVLKGKKKTVFVDPMCERYRRREWHRRIWGVHIMINGECVYLTNHHYFYLQFCKFDHKENDGYPFYYEFSRDSFYIRSWCENNPRSLGYLFIAARGTGKTNEELACIVNRATMFHNHRAALQSNDFEVGAKGVLIQAKTVPLFNALPKFFKPEFAHGTNTQSELVFRRRSISGKESIGLEFGPDIELLSTIFAVKPGEKVLDKETLGDALEDEVGKVDPKMIADVYVRHETNLKTVFRNHRKIGMLRKTTTVEEMNEGGDECHKLWKDSDMKMLDGNGFTTSKIHRHLISSLDTDTSLENYIDAKGKNYGPACNKYGRVNREIANIKIQNDFDALKSDLKKLGSRMRKSPRNETEAFIKDQSKSIFNVMLLSNRLEKIRNHMPKPPYVRGNLYWVKEKFGPVWWERDDHAGRFNWAWFPDEFSQIKEPDKAKILNNFGEEWGYDMKGFSRLLKYPKNDHLFRIGSDPIKYSKTKDPRASKASVHGFRLFDGMADYGKSKDKWESHNFIFEYINRPEDPETTFEDAAMACIFLGCKLLPERNVPSLNNYFETNGLEKFLAYPKDFISSTVDLQVNSDDAGYASTSEVIDYYTRRLIAFINNHIDRMPFDNTIEDWLNFDSANPTKSDATVSSGFTLVHAEKIAEVEEKPEGTLSDWFETYDNSGQNGTFAQQQETQ